MKVEGRWKLVGAASEDARAGAHRFPRRRRCPKWGKAKVPPC